MAKISFLQNPTFKTDVEIPRFGAKPVTVGFVFNYLDRDQMAELADVDISYSKATDALAKEDDSKVVDISERAKDHQFDQLKKLIVSWGFTEEYNDESLRALVNHSAEVAAAIIAGFRGAYEKARQGNLKA